MFLFRPAIAGFCVLAAINITSACAAPAVLPSAADPSAALAEELTMASGHYAPDMELFGKGPLATTLRQMLGDRYATFMQNMQVAGPLQPTGDRLFMIGNKQHEGDSRLAWLLTDRQGRNITVGLLNPGRVEIYTTGHTPLAKPDDIRTLLANMNTVPPLCNPAQDLAPGMQLEWRGRLRPGEQCIYRVSLHRGEQVTARLEPAGTGLEMQVLDPHLAPAGPEQSWRVPDNDLYLVQVARPSHATEDGPRTFSMNISAQP
ncbi:hypothetical protein D3W54_08495 [Komagataeibacter medellinensis]|uniref:Uncharacterized protein n=1 Tax=Komagataeibacter medellinensis TaxID=1177712 RepID=A0ABQ6VVL6_9PROT|nr:hypothetical protein [Komagataeibacter medellinensis]KAB8124235.1 hypothetical protein D3W54_08495 [Komagataeibacter medellinensis]